MPDSDSLSSRSGADQKPTWSNGGASSDIGSQWNRGGGAAGDDRYKSDRVRNRANKSPKPGTTNADSATATKDQSNCGWNNPSKKSQSQSCASSESQILPKSPIEPMGGNKRGSRDGASGSGASRDRSGVNGGQKSPIEPLPGETKREWTESEQSTSPFGDPNKRPFEAKNGRAGGNGEARSPFGDGPKKSRSTPMDDLFADNGDITKSPFSPLDVKTEKQKPTPVGNLKPAGIFLLFFGVIVPAFAIAFEATTHFCATNMFDPLPTTNHVLLVSLIPLSNFMYWLSWRRNMSDHYAFMALASGMALGVGILYSLMFFPLIPTAIALVIVYGFGLLPLAPLVSLPFTMHAGKGIVGLSEHTDTYFDAHQVKHFGHLIILISVIAIELPSTLTRIHLAKATEYNTKVSLPAIKWLRMFGNQEVMLRACYEHSGRATDIVGSLYEASHPIPVEQAREVFYKVTGKPFNAVPIPMSARATMQRSGQISADDLNAGVEDEFDLDPDIAGEMVSGVARGLSVTKSQMNVKVDADPALASIQWKFDFKNVSTVDREARAKILLPAGAVVNGAKIWVNGVERTATVMSRSEAREVYVANVHAKKDPLLVSNGGIDQVLVQCYPVTPNSKISVLLSIAAPLVVSPGSDNATLSLPSFAERNFQAEQPIEVTIDSTGDISAPAEMRDKDDSQTKFSGDLTAAQLSHLSSVFNFKRDPSVESIVFPFNPNAHVTSPSPSATSKPLTSSVPVASATGVHSAAMPASLHESLPPLINNHRTDASNSLNPVDEDRTSASVIENVPRSSNRILISDRATARLIDPTSMVAISNGPRVSTSDGPATLVRVRNIPSTPVPQSVVRVSMSKPGYAPPKSLEVIVDGSGTMQPYTAQIVDGLKALPDSMQVSITFIGDESKTLCSLVKPHSKEFESALAELRKPGLCEGGQSDRTELESTLSKLFPGSAILWIHASQPSTQQNGNRLEMLLANRTEPAIYDLQTIAGPDEILDGSAICRSIVRVPNTGDITASIHSMIQNWTSQSQSTKSGIAGVSQRKEIRVQGDSLAMADALAARAAVYLAASPNGESWSPQAVSIAQNHNIVTPVSSLIVSDPNLIPETKAKLEADREATKYYWWSNDPVHNQINNAVQTLGKLAAPMQMMEQRSTNYQQKRDALLAQMETNNPSGFTNGLVAPEFERKQEVAEKAKAISNTRAQRYPSANEESYNTKEMQLQPKSPSAQSFISADKKSAQLADAPADRFARRYRQSTPNRLKHEVSPREQFSHSNTAPAAGPFYGDEFSGSGSVTRAQDAAIVDDELASGAQRKPAKDAGTFGGYLGNNAEAPSAGGGRSLSMQTTAATSPPPPSVPERSNKSLPEWNQAKSLRMEGVPGRQDGGEYLEAAQRRGRLGTDGDQDLDPHALFFALAAMLSAGIIIYSKWFYKPYKLKK